MANILAAQVRKKRKSFQLGSIIMEVLEGAGTSGI